MTNQEINAACAEAMGWERHQIGGWDGWLCGDKPMAEARWNPAKFIADAWVLLEKLREYDCDVAVESCGAAWCVEHLSNRCCCATAPMVICLAFLEWAKAAKETL